MPITIIEQPDSRSGQGSRSYQGRQTRHYWAKGSSDIAAVIAALSAATTVYPMTVTCPVNAYALVRSDIRYKPLSGKQETWDLVCEYCDPQAADDKNQLATGSYKFSVSTTGGTARIVSSLATVSKYPAGTAPDFKQAIGCTREGDVQGVDIVVPACKFSISYRQPKATITAAYVRTVEELTGTVNNASFYGRAAGEVLFMGGDGSQGTDSDPTWDYQFIRMPNLTGQTIGDIISIAKKGHEYLWVLFEEKKDPAQPYVVKIPKAVYVERVYQSTSFSSLGIG